jgi:hypothetical protein
MPGDREPVARSGIGQNVSFAARRGNSARNQISDRAFAHDEHQKGAARGNFMTMISKETVVAAAPEQVSCDLAGEAAILDLKSGVYYGLDAVGARIWELIQQPKAVGEVHAALLEEYEVESERCLSDLISILQSLSDNKLIEVRDAGDAVA